MAKTINFSGTTRNAMISKGYSYFLEILIARKISHTGDKNQL